MTEPLTTGTQIHALIDVELSTCADFCVRQLPDGHFSIELGAALEVVSRDDLELITEKLQALQGEL